MSLPIVFALVAGDRRGSDSFLGAEYSQYSALDRVASQLRGDDST